MTEKNYTAVLRGTAFHAPVWGEAEVLEDCLFAVDAKGELAAVCRPHDAEYGDILRRYEQTDVYRELAPGQYLLPGFVDLHIHAPQWTNMGKALHVPLATWLQEYTFPRERKLAEATTAREVYREIVTTTLAHGTTTAVYFGSQDTAGILLLAEICAALGQRGACGKVVMDNPEECPPYYRDADSAAALRATREFVEAVRAIGNSCPQGAWPVITPRFVPSCTDATLAGLGELAAEYGVPIQTHIAESDWEAGYAYERFGKSDAEVLDMFGLLTEKSVVAHGTQLRDEDAALLAARGSTVAHCPLSNAFFGNGVYPVRRRFAQGVRAGLGTDVSGGYSPSLYDNIRQAVVVSRMLEDGVDARRPAAERGVPESRIDYRHALYMATTAGGEALGSKLGLFRPGYAFDAQLIDTRVPHSDIHIYAGDTPEDVLQKILFLANRTNLTALWVQGREVLHGTGGRHE